MRITNELMRETFAHFNKVVFGNEIPMPKFKLYNSKVNCGFFEGCNGEDNKPEMLIKISKYYNKNYQQFCETMLHEMVHCFQFINRVPVDHGKSFSMMARVIKKEMGIDIE